jgi:hypothetical protein
MGMKMRVYQSGRRTGKTTFLLSWLERESNRILIVHSAQERDRLLKEYPHIGANQIVTANHVIEGKIRGRHPLPELAIDNLDLILPFIFGGSIGPITMTGAE